MHNMHQNWCSTHYIIKKKKKVPSKFSLQSSRVLMIAEDSIDLRLDSSFFEIGIET